MDGVVLQYVVEDKFMAFAKGAAKIAGLALLTFAFWVSFNVARAQWAAHVQRQANIDAVFYIVDYNLKQGKLILPEQPKAK
jgi:hypothetical protein